MVESLLGGPGGPEQAHHVARELALRKDSTELVDVSEPYGEARTVFHAQPATAAPTSRAARLRIGQRTPQRGVGMT